MTALVKDRPLGYAVTRSLPPSAESPRRPAEHELSEIWERQRLDKSGLVDAMSHPVRVIYRGRKGFGPGPDFRDAIIAFEEGPRQGDVELHVMSSDFQRHGHHTDGAYNGVILHVVFFDDCRGDTHLADGSLVPVVAIGHPVAGPRPLWRPGQTGFREPCQDSVQRLGRESVGQTLDRLGTMRFRQKAAAWGKRLSSGVSPEQALWEGLLEALGYGGDSGLLKEAAKAVTWREVSAIGRDGSASVVQALELARECLQPNQLRRAGVRPGNSTDRRIIGAAELAARFCRAGGIGSALLAPLEGSRPFDVIVPNLTVPGLIGRARAIEIAGNVVLPLAAALCADPLGRNLQRQGAVDRFEGLYASLPLPARYGAVRHLHNATGSKVSINMHRQQGMLYLLRQYCSQGGCGKCPLS